MNAVERDPVTRRQALDLDGFRVERVQIRGGIFPSNRARQLRIIATLGAGWELRVDKGRRLRYDHGELVLLPPWLQRRSYFPESGDNLLITVEASLVERMAREIGLTEAESALPFQKLTDPTVYGLIGALAEEFAPNGRRGRMYSEALGKAVLGHILRGRLTAREQHGNGGGLSPRRLQLAQQYVEQHLDERLAVEDIAAVTGLSTFHFTRVFKQATGKTPHQYVLERRIAVAQMSVGHTTRPLNEISAELGFRNPSHFSAVFMEHTGMTPSEYRRRANAQQL
ncbi:MAG: AraC family transcriptional regulator [Candidatus Lustribacter sp.]|jgi:AraC family transcriptional regulator